MAKSLIVVESPKKAKTLKKFLGKDFDVVASKGHVKDLPKRELGVDVENQFEPQYVTIRGQGTTLQQIKKAARSADVIYLAPDPDREGEAIAFHIASEIKLKKDQQLYRMLINEITKRGVREALANPRPLDKDRFDAQQARRVLDRLVGYKISPILWDKVRRGLSAGRVQSVAVRLIVDREREIQAFEPIEYWTIEAELEADEPPTMSARLFRVAGEKAEVSNGEQATQIVEQAKSNPFIVADVVRRERKRNAPAPFTTSKLQQEAARHCGFSAKRTMSVAQRLYEGMDVGDGGTVGLITYMRTDSTRLSKDAVDDCRTFIEASYGKRYVPARPRLYAAGKKAQDAHEAIRPTSVEYSPERVKKFLKRDEFRLYELIWNRFIACQMNPARFDKTTIDLSNGSGDSELTFRATGSIMKFPGWLAVYREGSDDDDKGDEKDRELPNVEKGQEVKLLDLTKNQHFTKPPPRFTEASLVKELEEKGIGRPSTYASIISVIQDKEYVEAEKRRFQPTDLGFLVTDLLVDSFPSILDVSFTAGMETDLDRVAEGDVEWHSLIDRFYGGFEKALDEAKESMPNIKKREIPTDVTCDECGSPMVIRWGKKGEFLACKGYPDCRNTSEFERKPDGSIEPIEEELEEAGTCSECGRTMVVKSGRYGRFVACTGYPECKHTEPFKLGVDCPECGEGDFIEKRTRRGKTFYGCSRYPECKAATWNEPVPMECPECGNAYVERVKRKSEEYLKCPSCKERVPAPPEDEGGEQPTA